MARMLFAAVLLSGLAFTLGCGSSSEPTQPTSQLPGDPTPPAPATPSTAVNPQTPPGAAPQAPAQIEPVKSLWELDQARHAIPATPVKGSVAGVEVTPTVLIEGDELNFRTLKAGTQEVERSVKVKLAPMLLPGEPVPQLLGREWKVRFDAEPGPGVPVVWRVVAGRDPHLYPSGYALTLELGQRKGGKVAGKIYLSLPDEEKTALAGTFEAEYVRPHTERPGPDDVPYIAGEVAVSGLKADAELRVTYAAFAQSGLSFKELQLSVDTNPAELAQWTRDETEKSRLISGDGKSRPFRYEHVRLAPGRYLISAGVAGRPAVWKWVEVAAGGALTENFTLDAAKTGGVEVNVPASVTGKVLIAPADEASKMPMEADLFRAVALQVVRHDADLVSGKALMKDLAPGKYEVRAGDLRGFVEVAAGKTAELKLEPAKK